MTAPAYVGTGPAIWDPGVQWAPSLTVTAADVPSGASYDDTLVLTVMAYYRADLAAAPGSQVVNAWGSVDDFAPTPWKRASYSQITSTVGSTVQVWDLAVYTARNIPASFPVVLEPLNASGYFNGGGLAAAQWRAQLSVWGPAEAGNTGITGPTGTTVDAGTGATNTVPRFFTNLAPTHVPDATLIVIGALPSSQVGNDIGPMNTANGFTERHHEPAILESGAIRHGGSLKLADYSPASGSGFNNCKWDGPASFEVRTTSYFALWHRDPEPPPAGSFGFGLSMGRRGSGLRIG